jgi:hypothetical protein
VKETLEKLGLDSDEGTPASVVARAYLEIVTGEMQGQIVIPSLH